MTSAIYFTSAAVDVNPPSTYCARSRVISPMRFFICASTSCSVYSAVSSPSSSFFVSTVSLIRYKPKYRKTLISKKVSRLPESTSNKTFRLISSFKLHLRPERVPALSSISFIIIAQIFRFAHSFLACLSPAAQAPASDRNRLPQLPLLQSVITVFHIKFTVLPDVAPFQNGVFNI